MRILLIHRYFWPDTPPYASLLREIGEHWAAEGHDVFVLSSQPSYKVELKNERRPRREQLGSLEVNRVRLLPERSRSFVIRAINSLLFVCQIFFHLLLGKKYDVVMCSTVPPVVTGLATSLGCWLRGSKFLYHAMDVWPEVAAISGQMSEKGMLYRILRWLDTGNCRRASAVICLSTDMRNTFLERDQKLSNQVVINNFELPSFEQDSVHSVPFAKRPGRMQILFAGNLGRYQGLESVVEAAQQLLTADIDFVFLGDGSAKKHLIEQSTQQRTLNQNVFFLPHQPSTVAKQMMAESDLCLVTLAPGVSRVAYPSKTLTILAAGTPVAVMVERTSELASDVERLGLGIAVECGDTQALVKKLQEVVAMPGYLGQLRENVARHAPNLATAAAVLPKWSRLLQQFQPEVSPGTMKDPMKSVSDSATIRSDSARAS